MFSAFKKFGKLGALASSVARAWTPAALWPTGTEPGMWISPRTLTSQWQDSIGTTPVAAPGTVADSSNPVGLALDIRAGATVLTDPGNHMLQSTSAARPQNRTIWCMGKRQNSPLDHPAFARYSNSMTVESW